MENSRPEWPVYMVERARRPPPPGCSVVEGSTPVVFFGNPRAKIATISINPSYREFLDGRNGPLLSGEARRLATLQSLGWPPYGKIDERLGAKIIEECTGYFGKEPYVDFFRPLDRILRDGARASYSPSAPPHNRLLEPACHLDLSQWATSDIWSDLPESAKQRLLGDGLPFLIQQIRYEKYHLVIANGRTVKEEIETADLVKWDDANPPIDPPPSVEFFEAKFGGTQFLAWSCFVKYASQDVRDALARFIAGYTNERRTT